MKIISTNIGEKTEINWKGKIFTTGIYKFPSKTPIFLDIKDVDKDTVIDRKHHGGIKQAVYAYSLKHYAYWKPLYPNLTWNFGMFGENLTIDDLDETKIHVGDIFKVGEAIIEATKPRQPCYKLGARFNDAKMVKQFWNTTMSGIYFKILQTGYVQQGNSLEPLKSLPKNPTIADIFQSKKENKK